jgi:hypothetical protein
MCLLLVTMKSSVSAFLFLPDSRPWSPRQPIQVLSEFKGRAFIETMEAGVGGKRRS